MVNPPLANGLGSTLYRPTAEEATGPGLRHDALQWRPSGVNDSRPTVTPSARITGGGPLSSIPLVVAKKRGWRGLVLAPLVGVSIMWHN